MKNQNKGFIVPLIALFIAIIVAGGVYMAVKKGMVKVQNNKLKLIALSRQMIDCFDFTPGESLEMKFPCSLQFKVFMSDEVDLSEFKL